MRRYEDAKGDTPQLGKLRRHKEESGNSDSALTAPGCCFDITSFHERLTRVILGLEGESARMQVQQRMRTQQKTSAGTLLPVLLIPGILAACDDVYAKKPARFLLSGACSEPWRRVPLRPSASSTLLATRILPRRGDFWDCLTVTACFLGSFRSKVASEFQPILQLHPSKPLFSSSMMCRRSNPAARPRH